ncbi:MAG: hypothetical protein KDC71_21655 [Acidobacteria bacterium]|nr:hypothetical protein [Acidobacteriota bacterium]
MTLKDIIEAGPLNYRHHYMQTQVGEEIVSHILECPQTLKTLASNHPKAEVVIFGDDSLGIEIEGNLWAAELPHKTERVAKSLPHEIWQYCNLAMGRDGDTAARRH